MATPKTIRGRYELGTIIGRGGMGVVHKAHDHEMKRDVAVKMLHDVSSQAVLDLFYRECDILRSLVHPNVIDILDMGDFNDEGVIRPYYVMPLLPGKTLYDLLHPAKDVTEPLSVDRASEIIVQTARGLHAAHERELLHRDVKPRNIFVIDEYSVKLIDFGVAHLLGSTSSSGIKGTLEYMAPEQLKMKLLSRRTDIFSLATVSYEILTGRQPFRRATDGETAEAVTTFFPPLACDVNSSVPKGISQVINKAMAKEPLSRFATASEFAEALQRARRNEPMNDLFASNEGRVRRDRVRVSFEQKDYVFASEVLRELESEGQVDTEVRELRRKVDQALLHQNTATLYEAAERYYRADEYQLALRKVQEVLDLDKTHSGALVLRRRIEDVLNDRKIVEALEAARERMEHAAFTEARRILQDARKLRPDDSRVRDLLIEVDTRQKDFLKQRQEFERLYQSAQASWVQRDISQALVNLERLAELTKKIPEPRDRIMEYESFYKIVKTEHDALLAALEQATKKVAEEEYGEALALCGQYLGKYPRHAGFTALKTEIDRIQRDKQAAVRADVERRVSEEPNLSRKIQILENARNQYPLEDYYTEELQRIRSIQVEVDSIVESAQISEESGDLDEALAQWTNLRSVYPEHPGLDEYVARLTSARSRADEDLKIRFREDFDKALRQGRVDDADLLLEKAAARFPGEFEELRKRLDEERFRKAEARRLLAEARKLGMEGRSTEALKAFRKAYEKDEADPHFKKAVIDSLVDQAKFTAPRDWQVAKQYLQSARTIDRSFVVPPAVSALIDQAEQADFVGSALFRALDAEKANDLDAAMQEIGAALARYPEERLLHEKRASLELSYAEFERKRERAAALDRCRQLAALAETNLGTRELEQSLEEVRSIATIHAGDQELKRAAIEVGQQLWDLQQAHAKVGAGDLEGARAVAAKYLQQSPQHAGFLAIQDQIAEQERQSAVEFMAEVDGLLFREPNLEKRIQILEEASRRYPAESHYSEELEVVRSEQALVRSVATEADSLEKAGRFKEALDQWDRMGAIYRSYPGLDAQINRLNQLYQQAQAGTKTKWAEQIQQALKESNYPQALELIRKARADFPDAFGELAQQARQGADRRALAQQRISEAQELGAKSHWEDCRRTLREAVDAAPGDPVALKQVLDAHAKHARISIKTDWKATEALLDQASALDPSFKTAGELRGKIDQLKRSEFVELTVGRAREQQQAGDLKKALATTRAALEVYPGEPTLTRWRADLESDLRDAALREERRQTLEELKQLESVTRQIDDPTELRQILERVEGLAKDHTKDREFSVVSDDIRQQMEALESGTRLLDEGKFDEADAMVASALKRFGEHSAFRSLQQKIAEARDRVAVAYLDEVTGKLDREPSLEGRIRILEEATRRYPAESHYREALEMVRAEQERVRSIAAEAEALEKAGRFKEALDRWHRMGTIYRSYPGLDAQIARLTQLHQKTLSEAEAKWTEQIRQELSARNYPQALELIRKAQGEFPDSFDELARQAQQGIDRRSAGQQKIEQAQDCAANGRWEDCRLKLRQAIEVAPGDPVVARPAIEAHSKHARTSIKTDWKAAETLLEQAAALDPSFKPAGELTAKIEQSKRAEFVQQAMAQAAQQRQAGELQGALQTMISALEVYPGEAKLVQSKTDLETELRETAQREQRRQSLDELKQLEAETRQIVDPDELRKIRERAEGLAREHKQDREFSVVSDKLREQVEALEKGKRLLQNGNLDEAEKHVENAVTVFGALPALLGLKQEIDEAQQRSANAYLEQIARQLQTQPDLALREKVLIDALARYPNQPRFQQELAAIIKQQQKVAEAVKAARAAEKAGRYAEAIESWTGLQTLYRQYPNLDQEIERLKALLSAAQSAAREAAFTEICAALDASELERAAKLLKGIEPGDKQFGELRTRLNALQEAMRLIELARKHFARRKYSDGISKYREAAQQVPQETRVILIIVDELTRSAAVLLESDWRAAEAVLRAAHGINPKHSALAGLWARYEEKQRQVEEESRKAAEATPPAAPLNADPPTMAATRLFDSPPAMAPEVVAKPDRPEIQTLPAPPEARKTPPWVWIGVAAAVVLTAILIARMLHKTPIEKPALISLSVGTDPPGASVNLGNGASCVTPNCQLQLAPGNYTVTAEKNGYRTAQRSFTIDGKKPTEFVDVTLQPVPPPLRPPIQPGTQTGTLVIKAGIPDALVFVDNAASGRTTADGSFTLQLEAKTYDLRLEKVGYEPAVKEKIKIGPNATRSVLFVLVQQNAKLELRGAPAGVEVSAGGNRLGRTDGSASYTMTAPLGNQTLQFTTASGPTQRQLEFRPGETVPVEWSSIVPPAPKKVDTVVPDPAEQAWEAVKSSRDIAQIEAYTRKYSASPHNPELNQRLEGLYWTATDQNDAASLRAYLTRYPRGTHARDAQTKLQEIAWNGIDKTNAQAVRDFIAQNPDNPFVSAAKKILDKIKEDADAAEAERKLQVQRQAILAAIEQFNAAFDKQRAADLKRIWPTVSKDYIDLLDHPQGNYRLNLKLHVTGAYDFKDNTASVICELMTTNSGGRSSNTSVPRKVKVTLNNTGDHWVIVDPAGKP